MSSFFWACVALVGLCFGIGALLIRHIFEESEEGELSATAPHYGIRSAPALALAVIGCGSAGTWLAPLCSERPLLFAAGALAGAILATGLGLPLLNIALSKRSR